MSFPRYPKYKDSGVEWLGEVPEHWGSTALKRLVDPSRPITYGIVQAGPDIVGGVPYIRPADMTDEEGVASPDGLLRTSMEIATAYTRSTIRPGDLVCSIGPSFGKVMVTPDWLAGANLTQGTARVAVRKGQHPRYVFWALRSGASVAQWESSVGGATFRALNLGPLAETILSAPPLGEQQAIAAFLDRETAKIDALIAEQQRLIELLQEKRQAVISHAVTKGLNPDARMKDSGIEWFGEVPEHWKIGRCRFYVDMLSGFAFPSQGFTDDDADWRLLRGINVGVGSIRWDDTVYWRRKPNDDLDSYEMREGDLVIGMDRPLISDGMRVARLTEQDVPSLLLQRVVRLTPLPPLDPEYLRHLLGSEMFVAHFAPETTGVSVPHISPDQIAAFVIPVPPIAEQRAIVSQAGKASAELGSLISKAGHSVTLLQERRSALISAAVTGQIDVRGLAGSEAA